MMSLYADSDNHKKWWPPPNPTNNVDQESPHLCHLPLDLGRFAAEEERTPMNMINEVSRLIAAGIGGSTDTMEKLVMDW